MGPEDPGQGHPSLDPDPGSASVWLCDLSKWLDVSESLFPGLTTGVMGDSNCEVTETDPRFGRVLSSSQTSEEGFQRPFVLEV